MCLVQYAQFIFIFILFYFIFRVILITVLVEPFSALTLTARESVIIAILWLLWAKIIDWFYCLTEGRRLSWASHSSRVVYHRIVAVVINTQLSTVGVERQSSYIVVSCGTDRPLCQDGNRHQWTIIQVHPHWPKVGAGHVCDKQSASDMEAGYHLKLNP